MSSVPTSMWVGISSSPFLFSFSSIFTSFPEKTLFWLGNDLLFGLMSCFSMLTSNWIFWSISTVFAYFSERYENLLYHFESWAKFWLSESICSSNFRNFHYQVIFFAQTLTKLISAWILWQFLGFSGKILCFSVQIQVNFAVFAQPLLSCLMIIFSAAHEHNSKRSVKFWGIFLNSGSCLKNGAFKVLKSRPNIVYYPNFTRIFASFFISIFWLHFQTTRMQKHKCSRQ